MIKLHFMLHVMVNPSAGAGRARAEARQLEQRFIQLGLTYAVYFSQRAGDLRHWTRDLALDDTLDGTLNGAVIAVGGDGTVSEVVAGILSSDSPRAFCALPCGSGNDFAHALGWRSLADVVAVVQRGRTERIDLVRVNGQIAAYGLGMGFDAQVAADAEHAPAWLRGLPRYLWAILRVLPSLRTPNLRLEADGVTVFEGNSVLAAAMNTPTAGGGFKLAPSADPQDGLLEIMVGGDLTRWQTLLILPKVIAGTHVHDPKVQVFKAQHARFTWQFPMHAHTDGEQLPPSAVFEVECLPSALEILR
jgi:diacylglycerol kinase (ATP)